MVSTYHIYAQNMLHSVVVFGSQHQLLTYPIENRKKKQTKKYPTYRNHYKFLSHFFISISMLL